MTDEEINRRFEVLALKDANGSAWVEKFPGRLKAFPAPAHDIGCRIEALDIGKWLNWDYQTEDLAEVSISPYGCVVGWDMGLGKTRLAIALCLLGGSKHNLHVTEAHLVPEVVLEFQQIGLPESFWRVIDSPEALAEPAPHQHHFVQPPPAAADQRPQGRDLRQGAPAPDWDDDCGRGSQP